jgi:hypothetical protein
MTIETVFFRNHGTERTTWPFLVQITKFVRIPKSSKIRGSKVFTQFPNSGGLRAVVDLRRRLTSGSLSLSLSLSLPPSLSLPLCVLVCAAVEASGGGPAVEAAVAPYGFFCFDKFSLPRAICAHSTRVPRGFDVALGKEPFATPAVLSAPKALPRVKGPLLRAY